MSRFIDFTEVTHHGRYHRLVKAWRDGQWWMLKGLDAEHADDPVLCEMLFKELELCMKLRHPSIVAMAGIETVDELDGTFIVEEWLPGMTLAQWMRQPRGTTDKLDILRQLVEALAYCHRMQVVHRDVKPSNAIVSPEGRLTLIDFGIAVADNYEAFTAPGGTRHYMAPEQHVEGVKIDGRADLYAIGRIMSEMELPKRYDAIINCLLEDDRERRYANAQQLLDALDDVRQRRRRTWVTVALAFITAAIAMIAWFAGSGPLGNQLLGLPESVAATVPPKMLDPDDSMRYFLDTVNYRKDLSRMIDSLWCYVPRMPHHIPTNISEDLAVDLGLSVQWAPFNVGCDHATLHLAGGYYAYGDPTGKLSDINDNTIGTYWRAAFGHISSSRYDIARVQWGGRWRMARKDEMLELLNRCQWTLIQTPGMMNCYVVTGPNGNSIVLPCGGFRYNTRQFHLGYDGYYWYSDSTSGKTDVDLGPALHISPEGFELLYIIVFNGFNVRPVLGN